MNKEILMNSDEERLIEVLKYMRKYPRKPPRIADWQRKLNMGFFRACRIAELLAEAGVITSDTTEYQMLLGEDGKLHKKYLPKRTLVSVMELNDCIKCISVNKKEEKGTD